MYWKKAHKDYINLPYEARQGAVRFRWWQPIAPDVYGWSLDDIYIGGLEINTHKLIDDFNTRQSDQQIWEFTHGALVTQSYCGKLDHALKFIKNDVASTYAITRQLIIQENYIIQFKVNFCKL